MPADTRNICRGAWQRSWPTLFTQRRKLIRDAENKPYFKLLRSPFSDGKDAENEDEGRGEDEDELEGDEVVELDGHHECDKESPVETFMKGGLGELRKLKYHDQVQQVLGFCDCNVGNSQKQVALLDDRCRGDFHSEIQGYSRPYLGPLTAPQLQAELERARFKVSDDDFSEKVDAERRLIYITGLDPLSILALLATAPTSQAQALKDLIYRHLMGVVSIGVYIPSQGFRHFTLHCNIPYYALRPHKELCYDHRKRLNGDRLRQSWMFPSISRDARTPAATDIGDCVYEAHMSITVTGIDHFVWTAYGMVDTYFDDTQDSVVSYHQLKGIDRGRADPLACGFIDADRPIWTPREYFLIVVKIRLHDVVREWSALIHRIEIEIQQSKKSNLSLFSGDLKIRHNRRREAITWISETMKRLRDFEKTLSEYDLAWEHFNRQAIDYFLDGEEPASSGRLRDYVEAVDASFADLRAFLRKVEGMMKELTQDYPQGLCGQLLLENNEAALFQQRSANHIQVFTYLSIGFIPLAVASSLFSMQGVLPFTPNFTHFTFVFAILSFFVLITLIVHFYWEACLQISGSLFSDCKQRAAEAMKRSLLFRERRIVSDIEAQVEQGGMSSNGIGAGHQSDHA